MKQRINLEATTICNYNVSAEMKKVWQCELDILEEVDRICKKYNIQYFLSGGTLLGAIRHNGFIPWDDDIDLNMKRIDYEKFLKVAKNELDSNLFLQHFKTEEKYNRGHIQIRNSNTTAIIYGDKFSKFNKGIFIDIFPLDNIPNNAEEADKFIRELIKLKKYLDDYYNYYGGFIKKIIKKIIFKFKYLFVDYNKKIEEYEMLVSKYQNEDTRLLSTISFKPTWVKYKKEWFADVVYKKFEYLELPCPVGYDEILKAQYNNYMEFPKNLNGSMHGHPYFDVNVSYKVYERDKKIMNKIFNILENN